MAQRVQGSIRNFPREVGAVRDKWYFVGNGRTGECRDAIARSATAACRQFGWDVGDCVVILVGVPPRARRPAYPPQAQPVRAEAPRYLC